MKPLENRQRRRSPAAIALLVLGCLGWVSAASADPLPYTASFGLEIGGFPPVTTTSSGLAHAKVTGGSHIDGFTLPAGVIAGTVTTGVNPPLTFVGPTVALVSVGVRLSNRQGLFLGSFEPPRFGLMPFEGTLGLFIGSVGSAPTGPAVTIPMTGLLGVPGTLMTNLFGLVGLSVSGNAFVTSTVSALTGRFGTASTVTRKGGVATTLTTTSLGAKFKHTTLNYVTPTQIALDGGATAWIAAFGSFEITLSHEVPEPLAAWLLGAGLVGAVAVRRRREVFPLRRGSESIQSRSVDLEV